MSSINTVFGYVKCHNISNRWSQTATCLWPTCSQAPTPVFLPKGSGRAQAAGWNTQKEGANTSKYNGWCLCNFNPCGYKSSLLRHWTRLFTVWPDRGGGGSSHPLEAQSFWPGPQYEWNETFQCCCLKIIFRELRMRAGVSQCNMSINNR